MKFIIIESGSKGNATLIIDEGRILLIDMGVTLTALREVLKSIDKNLMNLDALLLTHSHSDHTKGVRYLDPLPIYCTEGTFDSPEVNIIKPYKFFKINHICNSVYFYFNVIFKKSRNVNYNLTFYFKPLRLC